MKNVCVEINLSLLVDICLIHSPHDENFRKSHNCYGFIDGWMDEWMTCDFTSCLTVFQLYPGDKFVTMKGCVQWNPVYD